jgi:hypothetical protein
MSAPESSPEYLEQTNRKIARYVEYVEKGAKRIKEWQDAVDGPADPQGMSRDKLLMWIDRFKQRLREDQIYLHTLAKRIGREREFPLPSDQP